VPENLRRVIREHRFERELRRLVADAVGADEFVEGAEWLLARDPLIGVQMEPDSPVWFLTMAPIQDAQISLYYTFNESTVWLLSIVRI
jgi:hypothetical protein